MTLSACDMDAWTPAHSATGAVWSSVDGFNAVWHVTVTLCYRYDVSLRV